MPRSKNQIEQIKTQRKNQILQTALRLFAQKGYYSTSIDQIAKELGISKGLFYNYFNSKQDLLIDLTEKLITQFDQILKSFNPENITELDIENIIRTTVDLIKKDSKIYRFYFMLYMQPEVEPVIKPFLLNLVNESVNFLTPFFEKHKKVQNPKAYILALLATLDGMAFHYLSFQYPEFDQIVEIIIEKYIKL